MIFLRRIDIFPWVVVSEANLIREASPEFLHLLKVWRPWNLDAAHPKQELAVWVVLRAPRTEVLYIPDDPLQLPAHPELAIGRLDGGIR